METYAIIIGVNHYIPPSKRGLRGLKGAIVDAERVYEWVCTHGGVPAANAYLILSTEDPLNPEKKHIDRVITEIIKKIEAKGQAAKRLYFFFAGHGLAVELDRLNNGMCMADWSRYDMDATAMSSSEYLKKFINEGLFHEVVLWMDCCRETKLHIKPHGGGAILPYRLADDPVYMYAFAAQYEKQAFEYTSRFGETRGVFTDVLLEGLNGAANVDGYVTARSLSDYLIKNVQLRAQENGFVQKPSIHGSHHADNPILF